MADVNSPREDRVKGNWMQFKGKLKEAWGELTDDELDKMEGRREQLLGYLQEKSGREREEVERALDESARTSNYRF